MPKNTSSTPAANAPVKTFRLGVLKAAVWANEADGRTFYSVTFTRSYQDDKDNWHDVQSFNRDDLLNVAKLADQAHTFIYEQMAAAK